ncbi:hypothetical protein [Moorena sp. SIO3A2]|uniref:hypothetical protein n=2 Tax=unclassified Moorena TaxID=2683338 RepID=UPI0013BD5091|nr:hypothetical protein [Moorena sp. SIO3A2]NER88151.1 hypothetical protein [Moorena sp. SIO3A2]
MRTLLEVLQMVLLNKRCRGATRGEFNYGSNAPLRSWGGSAAKGGSPHDRAAVVSPGDKTLDRVAFIVSRLCRKGLNIF